MRLEAAARRRGCGSRPFPGRRHSVSSAAAGISQPNQNQEGEERKATEALRRAVYSGTSVRLSACEAELRGVLQGVCVCAATQMCCCVCGDCVLRCAVIHAAYPLISIYPELRVQCAGFVMVICNGDLQW